MKTYIYILQHPDTLEVRYVGKTNNPNRRLRHHLYTRSTSHCANWVKSLKETKPLMTIIDETNGDWQYLEMYWIEQFKQWGFNLTNYTLGGEGAYGAGEWNNKRISIYDLVGNYIKTYDSVNDCAKDLECKREVVSACVQGRNKTLLKQYQVLEGNSIENIGKPLYKEYEFINKPEVHWCSKEVKCIEDDKTFSSITEASKYYGISVTSINNILNGRAKKSRCGKSFTRI